MAISYFIKLQRFGHKSLNIRTKHHLYSVRGWLANFKRRHNIKRRVQYGNAQDAYTRKLEEEMRAVQTLCGKYQEDEIYNIDETGLCWQRALDAGLTTSYRPGIKKEKACVSIVCCSNYTGTHKLPLWIIGNAKVP